MNKIGKISTILLWVLVIVSAVLMIMLMSNLSADKADPTMRNWINIGLYWTYILLAVTAIIAIVFGLISTFSSARAAKRGLISIGFLVVVFVVSYLLASNTIPQFPGSDRLVREGTLTPNIAKIVETGLYATYILLGLTVISILVSTVTRLFK